MAYLVDTNFLISCWRNANQPDKLQALQPFLGSEIRIVWVVKAEFLRGSVLANHDLNQVSQFLDRHKTIWPDEKTLTVYAQLYKALYRTNQLIGPHDLWIAASAIHHKLPILTRNVNEFQRVPGLKVVPYTI